MGCCGRGSTSFSYQTQTKQMKKKLASVPKELKDGFKVVTEELTELVPREPREAKKSPEGPIMLAVAPGVAAPNQISKDHRTIGNRARTVLKGK